MSQENTNMDDNQTNAPAGKPSQAEGERRETEESRSGRHVEEPAGRPSQAEGDRETIEEELGER
jgi:hypothetical protein